MVQYTEQVLEWPALIDCLANEAASTMGAARCRALVFAADLQTARIQQQETTEMVDILEGTHPLPSMVFPDIRNVLARAEKEGVLDGPDLRDIALVIGLGDTIRRHMEIHGSLFPMIRARCVNLQDLMWIRQVIDSCIDLNGRLRESASPELYQLTQKRQGLRQTMRRQLEGMLASQEYEDLLQGQYFAERENRYVIPVKAERQHAIDGIVHDISGSGATVFIEPRHLIELNNSIKFADLQVAQEERHILQDLSSRVADHVWAIRENLSCLADVDCLMAKARLSIKTQGSPIHLTQEPCIDLQQARHPLLALTKEHVIPNSIRIEGDTTVLIISGPNAGGKTVSLKLVGLFAMMVKVGLLPTCGPDSKMALFGQVYADIGDSQDLRKDVSSFSGHILNMIALLKNIGSPTNAANRDVLVLLDEVGSSTDPIEGAALAEAFLTRLCEFGCMIIATTHYPTLKTLAFRNPHVRNASQEFDMVTLAPTYRLIDGIPGGSSALEIAERLGLDSSIIQSAQLLIQRDDHDLDAIFRALQNTHTRLEREYEQAQHLRQKAQHLFDEAEVTRNQLQAQEREDRQRYRKQWQQEFSKAQRQLNQIINDLKTDKTLSKVRSIQQTIGSVNQEILSCLPNNSLESSEPPQKGDLVEIDPLGTIGILQESLEGKKQVSIRVGTQTIKTAPSAVRRATASSSNKSLSGPQQLSRKRSLSTISTETSHPSSHQATGQYQQELCIRGFRLDDAMEMTLAALDHALVTQAKYLKVIHGQGSGALKTGIRTFCQSSPYIQSFRPGDPAEGGDGVTVIELR
ncbi:endonuclease MutS2 [Candidatus Nitrospira allomarina]|uniref:Endonuclease MutS2 n=1 Tax=Candidatus Nitrospira allomarina TaxID=3020900 RepID=A0AA96JRP5_9BACT|nr:Smr/MutS family protein [Candidatus Nitrospira allomarina]WNM57165.1 Smr/MutS family protein [Candidatus Nitrospira allomarina]